MCAWPAAWCRQPSPTDYYGWLTGPTTFDRVVEFGDRLDANRCPGSRGPQVYRVVREMLPRERFGPTELLRWLEDTQDSNERAKRSHAKRRAAMRASPHIPP